MIANKDSLVLVVDCVTDYKVMIANYNVSLALVVDDDDRSWLIIITSA